MSATPNPRISLNDTSEGIILLEQWTIKDGSRRFRVEWAGPVITIGATGWRGGWKVMLWTTRHPKRKLLTYLGGRSLVKAANAALARYVTKGQVRPTDQRIDTRS